jgi:hypothetical protein
VINASAAPGSYLGMDPAFLVWIPPIDESGNILSDDGEEILPTHRDIDPGSNEESPVDDSPPKVPKKPSRKNLKPPQKPEVNQSPSSSENDKEVLSKLSSVQKQIKSNKDSQVNENLENRIIESVKSEVKKLSLNEKETIVVKSPTYAQNISEYYELSDIKFADDE